ncbi:SDR family NAD(P)-dependent oxidoreductase [Sphingomonas cavernae]|uniref:SDR family NAD(P)-dependent oxidoreductase n=1 Tax=Sphingomonas cavernae TaxID=2320861 RepID=UPI003B75C12E
MRPLAERVAIVTGAGAGLGRAHALFLAGQGAKVVVNDLPGSQGEGAAADVARAIQESGGEAMVAPGSVTDETAVQDMVDRAVAQWGRIDILVNNAGILRDRSFTKMTMEEFRQVVEVHLMGSALCTKAVWDIMREQTYGRVVMTTSSSGLYGNFGQANYAAAKMAVVGLMQTLAIEGEKYNIKVNCLAPAASTAMMAGVMPPDILEQLDPALVSPALLPIVSENAPTRVILCAGGGHFAAANITLTEGTRLNRALAASGAVIARWDDVVDRRGEVVPAQGWEQLERAIAANPSA